MPKLTIAKHSSGKLIAIRDAANGLTCDCICLCCGDRLIARQGEINKGWSFAHESGAECAGAVETALHKSAIQLICDEKKLYLGEYDPIPSSPRGMSKHHLESIYNQFKQSNPKSTLSEIEFFSNKELAIKLSHVKQRCMKSRITFSEAYGEKRAEGSSRRPDITATYKGQKIYIEIVVTHECDKEKISDLELLGVPTIQINISSLLKSDFSLTNIRDAITGSTTSGEFRTTREWLVKPKYILEADEVARQFFDMAIVKVNDFESKKIQELAEKRARRKIITVKGTELHIDQRETWGTIWFSGRTNKSNAEDIDYILQNLKAKRLDNFWTVQGANILEKIQSIQEDIAIKEQQEQEKQDANKRMLEEETRKKLNELRAQREEEVRLQKIVDKIHEAELAEEGRLQEIADKIRKTKQAEEEKALAEQERLRKIKEKETIVAVEKKYADIVHYQFRYMKINEELKALGINYS